MITETSPILSLLFTKGLGVKTLSHLVDRIVKDDLSVEDIIHQPSDVLVQRFGLRPNVAEAIHSAHEQADRMAQELEDHEVQVLVRGMDPYPNHLVDVLGSNAPPVLFVRGDLSVLSGRAVGFCGARSASEKGIRVASESARQLAEHDVNVVSGYAKGVDLAAHRAVMEAGGVTTIVLAEGILHFRPKREVKSFLDDHNYLVVSEYSPRLPWSGRNAMQRNKTIIGLSDAVICIESGMKGGTYAAAESTLALGLPLFVADYAQPAESATGNQHFISQGATPLRGDHTGTPNLKRVFCAIGMATNTDVDETAENELCDSNVAETEAQAREEQENDMPKVEPQQRSKAGMRYPKRLIEVDLPIARISAHARREKSIRHGHISTLHIWWARRPLAACRAVICASLWPDPADELCPPAFREVAVEQITQFAKRVFPERLSAEGKLLSSEKHLSPESRGRWEAIAAGTLTLDANEPADMPILRLCLLDFIADFANWDNSTVQAYLETSRALTQAAHESLGGEPGTRPLVVDPFAGGGSIPLEALRVGADAFASDLNPVAVLLNKVVLEYIPKYGQRLADEVRKWGGWVKEQAEKELAEFYPKDPDGATPIAYLWARTILSEAPGDEVPIEVPLLRSLWLCKKANRRIALRWVRNQSGEVLTKKVERTYSDSTTILVRQPQLEVFEPTNDSDVDSAIVARASATCPVTGFTTPASSVRAQLTKRRGGSADARMTCVVMMPAGGKGRFYRLPRVEDTAAAESAEKTLGSRSHDTLNGFSFVPSEPTPSGKGKGAGRAFSQRIYGMESFADLHTPRQILVLGTLARTIQKSPLLDGEPTIQALLSFGLGRVNDQAMTLCRWLITIEAIAAANGGQNKMPVVTDFVEANTFGDRGGSWMGQIEWVARFVEHVIESGIGSGHSQRSAAQNSILPHGSVDAFITDPPYYDAFPYSDLSDFFLVWIKRALPREVLEYDGVLAPKDDEIVVYDVVHGEDGRTKDRAFFANEMTRAFEANREAAHPYAIGLVVFANKTTEGWEALLQSLIDAGWVLTASWPIDTERPNRQRAQSSAALTSSVHLVCRPRENPDGSLREEIGEWRDVLSELPGRIHEWMPRLAAEGVVGADAIFACLGPALEIFSRYSRVEKASGEAVPLREYLEQVWAAVSTEALSMIFKDADAAGLEPDARLTAMWLWTLGGRAKNGNGKKEGADDEKVVASSGYTLEYDAARKIAQGLGIHLEENESIVEVKGDKARLLPASERTRHLFGKEEATATTARGRKKKKVQQRSLFEELDALESEAETVAGELKPQAGETVLDRVHQSMILFASGRGEALRRFLVEDGAGNDARFWKLAQSLSALYPKETDEKRWVDGVLARKKGLGL